MVGCSGTQNQTYLHVQALPCGLETIKATPALRLDSTKTIYVASFMINHTGFKNLPGPKPLFFSEDPGETAHALKDSPRLAFDCMQTLLCRLLETEQITKDEAEAYLANPTIGRTRTPLVRTWESVAGEGSGSAQEKPPPKGTISKIIEARNYIPICMKYYH